MKAAAKNPAAEARFRRNLVKAMERGPVAAEAFLEKVAASSVQTEIAKRAGLESVVVASAIGPSAVQDVLASKVPEGERPIDKLVHVLQAEEQKRGFDAAESGGGPLGKTIAGQEKGLRQDPAYRAARDDLAARSLGFEPDSGKAVDVGRAWETRRELDGRFAEPVGDVGGHKIYPPDLLKDNRAQLAGVAELSAAGEAERTRRDERDWELEPTPERPVVPEASALPGDGRTAFSCDGRTVDACRVRNPGASACHSDG